MYECKNNGHANNPTLSKFACQAKQYIVFKQNSKDEFFNRTTRPDADEVSDGIKDDAQHSILYTEHMRNGI